MPTYHYRRHSSGVSAAPAFPPRLRVKRVQGHPGSWELTFAADGRAHDRVPDSASGTPAGSLSLG